MHIYPELLMPSIENVQNTHISEELRGLHLALLKIIGVMNHPQRDEALIAAAGVRLDRALFPLLVGIERFGPVGVVELAANMNRDHTTVSRQVAKLESLGLVTREETAADRRTRRAIVTPDGKALSERIDVARETMFRAILAAWDPAEVADLTRLTSKFADAMLAGPEARGAEAIVSQEKL
jgi:DNA-binding MarR family transcriptional regulator